MKNKIFLILCLAEAFPLCASAPSKQEIMQKAREQARQQEEQEQKPVIVQKEEKEECRICLHQLHVPGTPTKTLDCGAQSRNPKAGEHTFHTACIDQWLARNPRCPICRTAVPQNEIPQILIPDTQIEAQQLADLLNQAHQAANQVDDIALQRDAQLLLGNIYRTGGNGIVPNLVQARAFYEQASQADDVAVQREAQLRLGNIHHYGGDGIVPDLAQAVRFYDQASQAGAPAWVRNEAQSELKKTQQEQIEQIGAYFSSLI